MAEHELAAIARPGAVAPAVSQPRPQPEEILVSVVERNKGAEIRVSIVRLPGRTGLRRDAMISVALWHRNPFKEGTDWYPDRTARRGTLLRAGEVPLVAEAMRRAVERARELGWELR